ncbi:porin [Thiomicrorhabdus arctica]|jgi:phosphate-selective porin|uniref:porin n=1 Tax=Thiomicrorhabdus arctica TaxID=131540 RepID=UPI000380CCD7|nr:porin [Thiomicrorhabdus arctica]
MKKQILKKVLPAAIIAASLSTSAQAANWLMLQGTEKANQAPRAKVWGFMQLDYQKTDDSRPPSGLKAAFNQMAPNLTTSEGFNVRRARIGVRGNNFPLDSKVNYFLLSEFGNNGITTGKGASQGQLTDASVTLNHIKGARIRMGLFKTPGSEEGMQSATVGNYINFSNVTDRISNERFYDEPTNNSGRNGSVSAFRDLGIQVFDSFDIKGWETSYALMLGNGNGLARTDNNQFLDTYAYLSTEKVFGKSEGGRRHGFKLYAWNHEGKRTFKTTPGEKSLSRSGLGTTYADGKYRATAEYIIADGMIYGGSAGAKTPADGALFSTQTDQKANGYYVDLGYRVKPNVELNLRYDRLNSGTEKDANSGKNSDVQREFSTTTLGVQYFFNKKTTLMANYEIRDVKAPTAPSTAPVHKVLDAVDNRIALQVRVVY